MIIRVQKKDIYVMLDKTFINDKSLSLKAKGLMTYLLSKPDGWHVQVNDIINQHADGEKSVRSGMKELIAAGYMIKDITRNKKTGALEKYDYSVIERPGDSPLAGLRQVGLRQVGLRQVGNRQLNNKGISNKLLKDKVINENNYNNTRSPKIENKKDIIIIETIKNKKRFNKIKKQILNMGFVGDLNEIIKLHNEKPKYVEDWVNTIEPINIDYRPALLLARLRGGVPAYKVDKKQVEKERRNYIEDEYAEFIQQ